MICLIRFGEVFFFTTGFFFFYCKFPFFAILRLSYGMICWHFSVSRLFTAYLRHQNQCFQGRFASSTFTQSRVDIDHRGFCQWHLKATSHVDVPQKTWKPFVPSGRKNTLKQFSPISSNSPLAKWYKISQRAKKKGKKSNSFEWLMTRAHCCCHGK